MAVLVDEPNVHVELTDAGVFHVQVREYGQDQGVESAARPDVDVILDMIQEHLERLAPVHYLVGLSGVEDLTLSERWRIAARMRTNRQFIARSALYGLTKQLEFAFRVILRVSGRDDLRVFNSREAATEWLVESIRYTGAS